MTRAVSIRGMAGMSEASMGEGALVRLSGVHKHYGNGVHALHDIDLHVEPGELLAVCGPSGHGKTTLMHLVALLEAPSTGSVMLDGADVSSLPEAGRAAVRDANIGLVLQAPCLVPTLSALENVLLPIMLRPGRKNAALGDARELGRELLARLGLATHVHRYPRTLNASQCQRVAIARALVTRPRLVVADEPTSRLDSGSVRMVLNLFTAWQKEHGTTFAVSTRDQRQLARAVRILQLSEGRLLRAPADAPRLALKVCDDPRTACAA